MDTNTTQPDMTAYDAEVHTHIGLVRLFLGGVTEALHVRGLKHDASKFSEIERSIFSAHTENRDAVPFGTPAYYEHLERVRPALEHHYKENDHHPEHHNGGIEGMHLINLIEMVCDWMAASMKTPDGDIRDAHASIDANQERFGYSDELAVILHKTVDAVAMEVRT